MRLGIPDEVVFEPDLKLMILTKENVAAQAFAEHIVSFGLPESVTSKMGRPVGYMELQKNKTNKTPLVVEGDFNKSVHKVLAQLHIGSKKWTSP